MIKPRENPPPITREEMAGKSPGQLITLFINRAGGTDFEPKQLDFIEALPVEKDGVTVIRVTVRPRPETGWNNGPVIVDVPSFDVGDFYNDFTVELTWDALVNKRIKPGTLIRECGGPPATPKEIRLKGLGMGQGDAPFLDVTYLADYTNIFFTGTLPLRVTKAPNNIHSLKTLNKILLNTSDLD